MLVAVGNEYQGVTTGFNCFIHGVLDQRSIDHRQHFLRNSLGGRQEAGALPRDRKQRLAYAKTDRKSVVEGKSESGRGARGCRVTIKNQLLQSHLVYICLFLTRNVVLFILY